MDSFIRKVKCENNEWKVFAHLHTDAANLPWNMEIKISASGVSQRAPLQMFNSVIKYASC